MMPSITTGKNEDGYADTITKNTNPKIHTETLAIDGSKHDSHQHFILMALMEKMFI